jgi:hypothetical protein
LLLQLLLLLVVVVDCQRDTLGPASSCLQLLLLNPQR